MTLEVTLTKVQDLRPIETWYNGCRFRSRLEARWAVFFDELGIKWIWEPEGYWVKEDTKYLIDFWLPHPIGALAETGWGFWAEMKPMKADNEELDKVIRLVQGTKHNALIFQGYPYPDKYSITKISGTHFAPPKIWYGLEFRADDNGIGLIATNSPFRFTSYPRIHGGTKQELMDAFRRAQSARFEFGEDGR